MPILLSIYDTTFAPVDSLSSSEPLGYYNFNGIECNK